MTACSRRCASSLLALSALLLAGCGGASPERVERAFAAQGIRLERVPTPGAAHAPWSPWPLRPARALYVAAQDPSPVISVVVYRGEGDAAAQEEYVRRYAGRSFEHFTRVGAVVVDWDGTSGPSERAALDRALASLR